MADDAMIEDMPCEAPGCGQPAAVHVPAILAQHLVDEPAEELVALCSVHAEEANAPQRPAN